MVKNEYINYRAFTSHYTLLINHNNNINNNNNIKKSELNNKNKIKSFFH